jgi:hypothetical protein
MDRFEGEDRAVVQDDSAAKAFQDKEEIIVPTWFPHPAHFAMKQLVAEEVPYFSVVGIKIEPTSFFIIGVQKNVSKYKILGISFLVPMS